MKRLGWSSTAIWTLEKVVVAIAKRYDRDQSRAKWVRFRLQKNGRYPHRK